ncbi:MAG: 2-oxoacid:acceptor oxidoreductase, partial [Methyloprofundus sp.]|nr:2-oxoacid:acceptor oxidoreductase [Methyloprofundus sp.]
TELALKHIKLPKPNTVLLGGFAALSKIIKMPALENAINGKFPPKLAEPNIAAAKAGYEIIMQLLQESTSGA